MAERVIGDRYQLRTMLGRGGMAVVWQGIDLRLGRSVAVKLLNPAGVMDPDMLERFDREARTAARLTHPNIVAVHDVGSDGDEPYLVMELVDGPNLAAVLADGPLGLDRVLRIAGQVCGALGTAHAAGVIHRDIKPANILLNQAGTVKVCDFGIARLLHGSQATLTAPATTIGTSHYMAPEQAAGDAVDARTDLYALGCLLYAMLTGHPPFTGDNPLRVMWQHLNDPAPALASVRSGIPADLDRLVGQLLAKSPADRPATATEVRDRLASLSSGEQGTAVIGVGPRAPAPGSAEPARAAASVVAGTRTMPAFGDSVGGPPAAQRSDGFGSRRVVTAALAATALAVIMIGILLATRPIRTPARQPVPHPPAHPPTHPPRWPPPRPPPAARPVAPPHVWSPFRRRSTSRLQAGQVDADGAEELNDKLDEVAQKLTEGDAEQAAKAAADVGDLLTDLRKDDKITSTAYEALRTNLDSLAESLPPVGKDRGNGNGQGDDD